MRNPLRKRIPRELRKSLSKYGALFVFICATVSMISGFLVADKSMTESYNKSFDKYNIEDGNFELSTTLPSTLQKTLEVNEDLKVYSNFYKEETADVNDATIRMFANREEVDKVCVIEGELPQGDGEIALDRMFADNNKLEVGDTLEIGGKDLKISGLVALSDYSALFSNNSDTMFDAQKFSVAIVTEDLFNSYNDDHLHYLYSYTYNKNITGNEALADKGDQVLEVLTSNGAPIVGFTPQYLNQAIHFAGDDLGSDKAMFTMLLYIIMVVIAFIFALLTSNTITQEASVIGTLRASGYKRRELVMHYITLPMLVSLIAALIGNILGYTLLKNVFAALYYGSYSLTTYKTVLNPEAFILTTVVPLIIIFVVVFLILNAKLKISPIRFMRNDLESRRREKAFKLSNRISFFNRFRIRVLAQNVPHYITMFIGITIANVLLAFGMLLPQVLNDYQKDITTNLVADYQYVLKAPVDTETKGAEEFAISTLESEGEEISVYGVKEDSKYVDIDVKEDQVYVSDGFMDKYKLEEGETIKLEDKYSGKKYKFKIAGVYEYPASFAVFMDLDNYNDTFNTQGFNGYFSDTKISDIDQSAIASVVTVDDLTKVSRQLSKSMGSIMNVLYAFSVIMFIILVYLLSRQIIERNSRNISMAKILGYKNREVGSLYINTTTADVLVSIALSIPLGYGAIKILFRIMMSNMSGWFPVSASFVDFAKMYILGAAAYILVMIMQRIKINKIKMSDVLKGAE